MPLKKTKTVGTVTGANLEKSNRGKKGGLTGSKRVTGEGTPLPDMPSTNNLLPTSDSEVADVDSNVRAGLAEKLKQGTSAIVGTVASILTENGNGKGNLTTSSVDFASIVATGSSEVPRYVEGMSNAESVKRRLEIQRQRNTVAVMTDNKKLDQDIIQLGIEHRKVEGKVIEYHTEGVHNQRKGVTFHRAEVSRDMETSRLVQDKELLTQQDIATQGTQALTPGIQKEWQQKLELQTAKSDHLKLEIESAQYENEYKRQELEAKLLSGF